MATHPDIDVVLRGFPAVNVGDAATVRDALTADCSVHIAGNHQLSGVYEGRDAVFQFYKDLWEQSGGTYRWEPQHMLVDGRGHVIVVRRVTAERDGKRLDAVGAVHITVVGDRIASIEQFESDLGVINDFWGGQHRLGQE